MPYIVSLIKNRDKVSEARFYKADLAASDLLMDLDLIIERIHLTDKQRFIMRRYWIEGYTQEEVAKELHVTQQMIEKQCRYIRKKIRKVLKEMGEIK